jgi:hypothetical protein
MGTTNKEKVQFVISHLEGCSGNFLGYLAADIDQSSRQLFRVDGPINQWVLSLDGRTTWEEEVETRFISHPVVVTHNYNRTQIKKTFPNARLIQIYPYTHIGNVLYNISHKKLDLKLDNAVDNYFLDITIWMDRIKHEKPDYSCTDYWCLHNKTNVEQLLGATLSPTQDQFFEQYWKEQLSYDLNMPQHALTIKELIKFWKIENEFSMWMVAWTIFVYEYTNGLREINRIWTINDANKFDCWETVIQTVESRYQTY